MTAPVTLTILLGLLLLIVLAVIVVYLSMVRDG